MTKTKGEYLRDLQSKVDKKGNRKTAKGRVKSLVIGALLCMGTAAGIGYETNASKAELVTRYESYRVSEAELAAFDNLAYEDTFEIWNSRDIGNDANTLLSGGTLYTRGPVRVTPSDSFDTMNVETGSGETVNINMVGSSLNVVGNMLYFRNDSDRHIYSYDFASRESKLICDGNVGEVFVSDERIYYIDLGDLFQVKSMDLDGSDTQLVCRYPVLSFVVFGDTIVYQDTSQNLYRNRVVGGVPIKLVSNVERFFIGQKIYAESKNTIIAFSSNGSEAEELYTSEFDDFRLLGYSGEKLIFQEDGAMKYLESGEGITICAQNHILYGSLSSDDSGTVSCIGYTDELTKELLVFESNH